MIQSPARLLAVRTMRETQKSPGVPFGALGVIYFSSAHAALCRVGAFLFCLK